MMNEENVTTEFFQTELGVDSPTDVSGEKEDVPNRSAVLGKFKDVDALVKAYESLQAEFTRRSQKLKELEKQASKTTEERERADSGAEKLRKNAQRRKEAEKEFEEFIFQTESSAIQSAGSEENLCQKMENQAPVCEVNESTDVEVASQKESLEGNITEADSMRNRSAVLEVEGKGDVANYAFAETSDELFRLANSNENVRLKIIGEYLRSIGKSGAPLTVGGGTVATPPVKPTSIFDAGNMALRYFKNTAEK